MDIQTTERITTLFENAPIGIGLTNSQGKILAVNECLVQMLGYSADEMVQRNVIEFYADPAQWSHLLEQLSTSDSSKDFGVELKHADGTLFFASVNVSKVIQDGQYVLLTMIEDVNEQVQLLEQLQTEISERKLLEEELESQIKLVDGLLDVAVDTIEIFDPKDMSYLKWNRTLNELTGYSDEEIAVMEPVADFIDEADQGKTYAAVQEALMGRKATVSAIQISKDGTRIPMEYTGSVTRDTEGNPLFIVAIGRDITDRQTAEEQLRFQALLLDTVEQSVIVTDLDGQVVYWNPFAERLFGWSAEEALGRNTAQLMRDVDDEQVLQNDRQMRATLDANGSWSGEYVAQRRDGTRVPLQSTITMVTGVTGQPTHFVGISSDISERKRAEKALQDSEKEYRSLIEKISDVIYAVDTNGMMTYLNPAVEPLIGLPSEELVGQPFAQFIHPEDLGRMQANFQSLLSGVALGPAEYRVLTTSGETRWIRVSSQPIAEEGKVIGIQGVLTDFTERKIVEEQIEEAATTAERDRLARELHDTVTQSLYSINLQSDAIRMALSSGNHDKAGRRLEILKEIAQEAMTEMRLLIYQLHPPVLQEEGLVVVLRQRLDAVEVRSGIAADLQVDGERRLPSGIETTLFQIAQEGLNNILKHARASEIFIRISFLPNMCRLTIKDNGVGFDTENLERYGGYGLDNMRDRLKKINGEMVIESQPGSGTMLDIKVNL